jgi:tRNA dimethylallyltransferase
MTDSTKPKHAPATSPHPVIVILGQTASGKSDLAVNIAKSYKGEVVSADSRQVYRGMNIGTGKVTKREMRNIPHHLLDVAAPTQQYSVSTFKRAALSAIRDIYSRKKLPVLCGGTGYYIQSVVDGITLPNVPPNRKLREGLEVCTNEVLMAKLMLLDPDRASSVDPHNRPRIVRAIEIADAIGSVPKSTLAPPADMRFLLIGIKVPDKELRSRIHIRLRSRIRAGMVAEVKRLHESGVAWKRMEALGLEYRYISRFLRGHLDRETMLTQLEAAIWKYARRQRTWFRRDARICWVSRTDTDKALKLVEEFIAL